MSERRYRVLTAVGSDRPGLIADVTQRIHEAGGNIEDSRMAGLGGEFALMVLVSGSADCLAQVAERLSAFATEQSLEVFFKDTVSDAQAGDSMGYQLHVSGLDHPGIVRGITASLARFEVNVESLDTQIVYAPMSGAATFVLEARLAVPATVSLAKLRAALGEICDVENLDFELKPRV